MTAIGFSPITYQEREEVGFVTWRIVASSPVPSNTVLRIDDVIGGMAASMYYYCNKPNLILNPLFYTGGVDYDSFDGSEVTLPAGETVVEFNVTLVNDRFIESIETFRGMLSIVSGNSRVTVDSNTDTATLTILDEADSMLFP